MLNKMISAAALTLMATTVFAQQAQIQGDTDKIVLKIPGGAALTLQSTPTANSTDNTSWVANGALGDTISASFDENLNGYTTSADLQDLANGFAQKSDLAPGVLEQSILVTSVSMPSCDQNTTLKKCESGDAGIEATFLARGLINLAGVYSCVVNIDGVDSEPTNATVTSSYVNGYTIQQAVCTLPAARHPQDAKFNATLILRENNMVDIPYLTGSNLVVEFYNTGPTISELFVGVPVYGESSILEFDGKTVPIKLKYGDSFDDDEDLTVSFEPITKNAVSASNKFRLDKKTKTVRIEFVKSFITDFIGTVDDDVFGFRTIKFTLTVTDSHSLKVSKDLSFNITLKSQSWNTEGSSVLFSAMARNSILQRAGQDRSAQLSLCYSVERDGWSTDTMHTNCDNKGPLLMILKVAGTDRIFGGYNHLGIKNTECGYVQGGKAGATTDGKDKGWLFNVLDSDVETVDYAHQSLTQYAYYNCPRNKYMLTWGGGHDWVCRDTYCYCTVSHSYDTAKSTTFSYQQRQAWCTGDSDRIVTPKTAFDFYEIYTFPSQ